MSSLVIFKLLSIFVVVGIGWIAGRLKWLGGDDPARVLGNAAYYVFIPALLFRTTARIDFQSVPWRILIAVFVPMVLMLAVVYIGLRRRGRAAGAAPTAAPAVRALGTVFGNTVQVGIPLAAALFGEAGLAIHLAIISLHAIVLLSLATALVELDLARAKHRDAATDARLAAMLATTARHTLIHPVVLPVLCGMAWNALGLPLPTVVDETLSTLGAAVVPLCLVLIGMSLAYHGAQGAMRAAAGLSAVKLLALPAAVLAIAHAGFGIGGTPLAVVVMAAALPIGSNVLVFAQRYRTLEAEITTATVVSTLAFALTAPLWLLALTAFP